MFYLFLRFSDSMEQFNLHKKVAILRAKVTDLFFTVTQSDRHGRLSTRTKIFSKSINRVHAKAIFMIFFINDRQKSLLEKPWSNCRLNKFYWLLTCHDIVSINTSHCRSVAGCVNKYLIIILELESPCLDLIFILASI